MVYLTALLIAFFFSVPGTLTALGQAFPQGYDKTFHYVLLDMASFWLNAAFRVLLGTWLLVMLWDALPSLVSIARRALSLRKSRAASL